MSKIYFVAKKAPVCLLTCQSQLDDCCSVFGKRTSMTDILRFVSKVFLIKLWIIFFVHGLAGANIVIVWTKKC